jgi:hypothetical protein
MARKSTTVDNPDYLIELAAGFEASQILFTAVELGLFGILAGRALTAEQIAHATKLPPRSLTRLLNGVAHLGLLQFKKGKYLNAPMSTKYLMEGKPEYLGDLVRAYSRMLYDKWGRLENVIRNDAFDPILPRKRDIVGNISVDFEMARRAMLAQHNYSVKTADELALNFDFSKRVMLLDLGGGSGIFSVMAAKKNPKLKATVFDFPHVCKVADEIITRYKVAKRVKTHPGNILKDTFPPGADVVLIAGVLDGYSEENCRRIVRKAYDYLPVGGAVIVKEPILNDNRIGPLFPALFSLSLLIETEGGDARTRGEMTAWLKEAGFKRIGYKWLTKMTGKFRNIGILTAVK